MHSKKKNNFIVSLVSLNHVINRIWLFYLKYLFGEQIEASDNLGNI